MVTGAIDITSYSLYQETFESQPPHPSAQPTQCCHIIPFSINGIKDGLDAEKYGYKVRQIPCLMPFLFAYELTSWEQLEGATIFWGILKLFGYHLLPDLNGDKINRLENVMTLSASIHELFDSLNFWLEEIEGKVG